MAETWHLTPEALRAAGYCADGLARWIRAHPDGMDVDVDTLAGWLRSELFVWRLCPDTLDASQLSPRARALIEAERALIEAARAWNEAVRAWNEAARAYDEAVRAWDEAWRACDATDLRTLAAAWIAEVR